MTTINSLRESFLSYYENRDHLRTRSAPLVPQNDPTLLFVNAGMVPFKNYFTGLETPPAPRAVSSQKCVRAGGKHNDLDNVGYTARHHTFFEMLGNFSFGQYFKEDAIAFAWNYITKELGLPPEKLLVTVYASDEEARKIWRKVAGLSDSRIIGIDGADNFWSMGPVGPCGPCSEIFFDHGDHIWGGPPGSAEEDGDRFIEIWNLVFMQFDQAEDGTRTPLPKPSIDTGMGLERMATVLQGVHNNYDTDLFQALIAAESETYGQKPTEATIGSFRVIADHLRAASFLVADGVGPSNEGRGYVVRRIMRRAMRHAHFLGGKEPLMHALVPTLVAEMGEAYPELRQAQSTIANTLEQEEARFLRTLGRGLTLLDTETKTMDEGDILGGDVAFKLYGTYGFPVDLTQDVLRKRGISVDLDGFNDALTADRALSDFTGSGQTAEANVWLALRQDLPASTFLGYDQTAASGALVGIVQNGISTETLTEGAAEILLDQTPFYAESGGQAGDHGAILFGKGQVFVVNDVQKRAGDLHVHIGQFSGAPVTLGAEAKAQIDANRRANIKANHSATHLLHAALRNVLGPHVSQKGSLVEAGKLRFDFSHDAPLTAAEIMAVETEVNAAIRQNAEIGIKSMPPEDAIAAGALALFGEKYGDEVRVLSMGTALDKDDTPYSVELCGGTHVTRLGDIAVFATQSETGVSSGVRRIEAVTREVAYEFMRERGRIGLEAAANLKTALEELPTRVNGLLKERKALEKELAETKRKLALGGGSGPSTTDSGPEIIGDTPVYARALAGIPPKELRTLADEAKAKFGSILVILGTENEGKGGLLVTLTDDLKGKINAPDLLRVGVPIIGGKGGGGRPDMAQGGGPDGDKIADAVAAIKAVI